MYERGDALHASLTPDKEVWYGL